MVPGSRVDVVAGSEDFGRLERFSVHLQVAGLAQAKRHAGGHALHVDEEGGKLLGRLIEQQLGLTPSLAAYPRVRSGESSPP